MTDSTTEPYRVAVPQAALDDLDRRLAGTRWQPELPGSGWTRGVPSSYLRDLVRYWRDEFDWRRFEDRINSFPQFTTSIDGLRVHFLHVRSPEPDATPLVLTHGWPGAVSEFLGVIGPLTDPRAHGGDPRDAFHVVVPTLPGFGFSGPLGPGGWTIRRTAEAWAELMRRLGYDQYLAQGGDAGSAVSLDVARVDPDHVIGVHVNMLMTFPAPADLARGGLDEADQGRLATLARFDAELSAYMKLQATRPSTLGHALTDSPVGQLAWIVERFWDWTDSTSAPEDAVNRDDILAIVSIYWLTATAGSSAQLYFEDAESLAKAAQGVPPEPVAVPIGVAVFPHDMITPIRAIAERDHPTISRWTEFDRGGHFAALEQPALLVEDVRRFARSLTTVGDR